MLEAARLAAAHWGLDGAPITLAAQRENLVFRVAAPQGDRALRLHRPGYRDAGQLVSELQWMAALAEGGLDVPIPLPAEGGALVIRHGEWMVDLLTWLPGHQVGVAGTLDGVQDRVRFCRELGRVMARLHDVSDAWALPRGFSRPLWDRAGLLGARPVWGRFWDHPDLTDPERDLLLRARAEAAAALERIEDGADFGLIHADLLSENMLVDEGRIALIDFDDGGWGFRDFELATFLLRFAEARDYPMLRAALCEGYAARRAVDAGALDLFMLLRALTYPGWIADRLAEPGARARSRRAIATATRFARRWLDTRGGHQ